ncbi:FAD-binding domain-containing protein [Marinobacter sp.]|uniref:FAD-binding domain-containing protein n=1 Tax=Marinobacter sp. TaxID=50741 RepID=UPI00384B67DD
MAPICSTGMGCGAKKGRVDYDAASDYGNWQYLAGVGADPGGLRQFNLERQAEQFDADGEFVKRWHGDASQPVGLHLVDAADWPVGPV